MESKTTLPKSRVRDGSIILTEYLSRNELAEELGVDVRTLDRWEAMRTGPPRTKIGKRVMYRLQAVQDWLLKQEKVAPRVDNRSERKLRR